MLILYPLEDNSLAIVTPLDKELSIEHVIAQTVPKGVPYKIVENNFKLDECFYESYEFHETTGVKINISKAKDIWLNHYRIARTPLLAALDVDFMRAVESGNTDLQKEIASKKQALRDVTKTELPNTLEEIKAIWPEILGQNPFNK